jgi:excisionase family DNA binding protein
MPPRAADPAEFAAVASDLNTVWNSSNTDCKLRKRIARTLIEEIIADIDDSTREIVLVLHWKGGVHTELRIPKLRRGLNRVRTPDDVVDAVRKMTLVCDDARIAAWLSRAGVRTAQGNHWTRALVASLRHRHDIPHYDPKRRKAEGWMTKKEAATLLGVAEKTVERAVDRGELDALRPLPSGLWIFRESDLRRPETLARFQQRRSRRHKRPGVPSPAQLTIDIPTT